MLDVPWWKRVVAVAIVLLDPPMAVLDDNIDAILLRETTPNLFSVGLAIRHFACPLGAFPLYLPTAVAHWRHPHILLPAHDASFPLAPFNGCGTSAPNR
jgi:hypothetical protein